MRVPFQVIHQIIKKKSILELQKDLSKDKYTTTIYLSKTSIKKMTQQFLWNPGKSRRRITPCKYLGELSEKE